MTATAKKTRKELTAYRQIHDIVGQCMSLVDMLVAVIVEPRSLLYVATCFKFYRSCDRVLMYAVVDARVDRH